MLFPEACGGQRQGVSLVMRSRVERCSERVLDLPVIAFLRITIPPLLRLNPRAKVTGRHSEPHFTFLFLRNLKYAVKKFNVY